MRLPPGEYARNSALTLASYAVMRALNVIRFSHIGSADNGPDVLWLHTRLRAARQAGYTGRVTP